LVAGQPIINSFLKEKQFSDAQFTEHFVRGISVSFGFWQRILSLTSTAGNSVNENVEACISRLLVQGTLKLYPIEHLNKLPGSDSTPKKLPAIPTIKGESFTLAPASTLLLDPTAETKTFVNKQQAVEFLTDLSMGDSPLAALAKAMDIPRLIGVQGIDTYISAMALSLVESKFVVMLNKPRITPQPASSGGDAPAETTPDKSANLGPHEEQGLKAGTAAAATTAADKTEATPEDGQEEEPEEVPVKCQYKKLTLTCRHGNTVTLDSAKPPMEGEALPTLQIVSSQNEDLKDANGKPIFDILRLDADIENVCDSHKTNFITIGDTDATLIGSQSNGKLAKFKSPSKKIKIGKSLLKYLWLPNVEADGVKTYKVCAVQSCDFSQFKGKGKCIRVEVYPHMKWSMSFSINLGSIKNDTKPSTNKMAFAGSLKLQQDNEKADVFTADYQKKLEVFEDTLDNFKKILSENIFDKFKEGRDFKINVDLPKIELTYDAEFKEKPGTALVVRTHSFTLNAAPLVKITASVDILPIIVKFLSSWWSELFNVFFGWVKQKKLGDEKKGEAYIKAGLQFTVDVSGELGAKFSHSSDENGKVTKVGEPVTSKITIKGEGKAELDGHLYVIKFNVALKAGVESSVDTGISMGEEEGAPYISLDFMFNGVKVYLEKEIQGRLVKNTMEASSIGNDMYGEPTNDVAGVKKIERSEPKVWLNMSKKHQLKYYLNKNDRQKIKAKDEVEADNIKPLEDKNNRKFDREMELARMQDRKLMGDLKARIKARAPGEL